MKEKKRYEEIHEELVEKGLEEKYSRSGIYSISIGDKLVYIGQSKDMLLRIANHLDQIESNKKTHKYIILREARQKSHNINFDVMQYCEPDELDDTEARLIQRHMPYLNYQIPRIGQRGYYTNPDALKVTLQDILNPTTQF